MSPGAVAPVPVAVVGAGGWGRNHVRSFAALPGAELRYVCELSDDVRRAVERDHPGVQCVPDLAVALRDGDLRAVVVATDAPSHHDLARACLESDKDVLVEKPLSLSVAESEHLCALADERSRILMVGHLLLYHTAVDRLRSLIDAGELGDIRYITTQRLNLGVVRRDQNAWWSLAPHDIALANHLLGAEPIAVSASGGLFLQRDDGIEDVVFATLAYPRDRLAHVHVSWIDPYKTRRLTVVGSRRMAVFDDMSADRKLLLYPDQVEPLPEIACYGDEGTVRSGDIIAPALCRQEPLRRECAAFIEAVRTRKPPLTDGRSGLAVVRVLEAGSRSLAESGRRVCISEGERAWHGSTFTLPPSSTRTSR